MFPKTSKSFESKHGCLFCLGYAIGKYYNLTKSAITNEAYKPHIKTLLSSIVSYLDDANLSIASIISLGEISRNGSLIFDKQEQLLELVDILEKKILTSKESNKLKEKAASTLGYMCINEILIQDNSSIKSYVIGEKVLSSFNKYIMQKLLDSSQAKQIELHMAIGEALVNAALGKRSTASLSQWTSQENDIPTLLEDSNFEDLEWLLNELFKTYLPSPNQHLRQSSCLWMLTIVKKCSKISRVIVKHLFRIQDAFIQRLSENDEITQEVASKGIGIIFSLADEDQKKFLSQG